MASLVARPADLGIVASLARVLMKLVGESNGSIGIVTLFHAVNEPNISIGEYITRIARYAGCSTECFVLCFVYINRIVKQHKNFVISVLNIHRLLITSVMVAAKFYDDLYYSNSFYAKIGGVKTTEINLLEAHFLSLIEFDLYVSGTDYEICRSKVASSEWWSINSSNLSKLLNTSTQWSGNPNKNKSIYSSRTDSITTTISDPISDNIHNNKIDKNMLQRMDTTYRNDFVVRSDKLQQFPHLQKLNHGQREKYQYNIARYNESFASRYGNDKTRTSTSFENHGNDNLNNGMPCPLPLNCGPVSNANCTNGNVGMPGIVAPPPCGIIGGPTPVTSTSNSNSNLYEIMGQANVQNSYSKYNSQQLQQETQLLDRCYSLQTAIPGVCQKQQYQGMQQIRHSQQLHLWQMQSNRRDTIERQTRNIQNTAVIQHRNQPSFTFHQQQKHNRQPHYGYNNLGGYSKSINKMVRRDIDSLGGEVREKPQYRRSITRHVSDRPVPIGCPSFQDYDY